MSLSISRTELLIRGRLSTEFFLPSFRGTLELPFGGRGENPLGDVFDGFSLVDGEVVEIGAILVILVDFVDPSNARDGIPSGHGPIVHVHNGASLKYGII